MGLIVIVRGSLLVFCLKSFNSKQHRLLSSENGKEASTGTLLKLFGFSLALSSKKIDRPDP